MAGWKNSRPRHTAKDRFGKTIKQLLQNIDLDALNLTYPDCNKTPPQLVEDAGGTPKNPGLQVPLKKE